MKTLIYSLKALYYFNLVTWPNNDTAKFFIDTRVKSLKNKG